MNNTLYIVMPAYNEEANIRNVIKDWYPVIEKHNESGASRLVIINDGSRDMTGEILDEEAKEHPFLTVLHKENSGHGPSVLYGYRYAVNAGADYVFQTDSDGQTLASEFEPFWRQRDRFDCVIGRRVGRQDGLSRAAVSKAVSVLLLAMFGIIAEDANTPYRLMKAGVLSDALRFVEEDEPLVNIMLTAVFKKRGMKVLYRNITFRNRQGGKNTINPRKIASLGAASIKRFRALGERLKRG